MKKGIIANTSNGMARPGRTLATKGIIVQVVVSLLCVLCVAVIQSNYIVSVLLGCISFVVPHSIFAYWVFRYAGATKNEIVAQSFSQGMKLKLLLTSGFFIIAFSYYHAHPLPLLGAYAIVMVSQWLAMYYIKP